MNVDQQKRFAELERAAHAHGHNFGSWRRDRFSITVVCRCGKAVGANHRNALARTSQLYGALAAHYREVIHDCEACGS